MAGSYRCCAWTGRARRAVIVQRDGESPVEALRRALADQPSRSS